jgi:hypothetical protein
VFAAAAGPRHPAACSSMSACARRSRNETAAHEHARLRIVGLVRRRILLGLVT